MQDGGIGWARSMAARAARPTSFLSCHRTSMRPPPPVGGTFWFQIFIQAPSPEIWRKTISGGEEVLARKWGGLFWATSLEKIFGGVTAIISFRPGGWIQQSAVPRCAILSMGSTGVTSSEAARVHIAHHHRSRVAARGARAAAGDAGDRRLSCNICPFLLYCPLTQGFWPLRLFLQRVTTDTDKGATWRLTSNSMATNTTCGWRYRVLYGSTFPAPAASL